MSTNTKIHPNEADALNPDQQELVQQELAQLTGNQVVGDMDGNFQSVIQEAHSSSPKPVMTEQSDKTKRQGAPILESEIEEVDGRLTEQGVLQLKDSIRLSKFRFKMPLHDEIPKTNIESENENIQGKAVFKQRELEMRNEIPDIDSFIVKKFSQNGMKNIYGDNPDTFKDQDVFMVKRAKEETKVQLVDCQLTTVFFKAKTYFILAGYQQGYKFNDGTYAQGRTVIRIYKMDPAKKDEKGEVLPDELLLDRPLNNINFKYNYFKNYCPILKHQLSVYFFEQKNFKEKKQTELTLWRYDIDREDLVEVCKYTPYTTELFGAHVSFVTLYPELNIGQSELKKTASAIIYYRSYEKEVVDTLTKVEEEEQTCLLRRVNFEGIDDLDLKYTGPEIEYSPTFKENDFPQPFHLWISKDGGLVDIAPAHKNNEMYLDQKNYKMSKPYYTYKMENGTHKKLKMSLDDKTDNYLKLLQVFRIEDEDSNTDSDSDDDENNQENQFDLQTINIIDDQEEYELSVFYVYGNKIEFKRYKNQRYRPMTPYVRNNLHYFSKFAQKYRQGLVHEKFKNVFVNLHEEIKDLSSPLKMNKEKSGGASSYGPQVFLINKEGKILKASDPSSQIYSEEDYRVYDDINGEKRFHVARIENRADNPFIRFRIVGDWNSGLNIQFTRYRDDEQIALFKVMTYFSEKKYRNVGLSWSNSMYTMFADQKKTHENKICQNIQWAQMSPDQIYCEIIEYEISWPKEIDSLSVQELQKLYDKKNPSQSQFQINVIGMKVVLFKSQYETVQKGNWFYPMYDDEDQIEGTQWVPVGEKISKENQQNGIFYQLKNYGDNDYQYETDMVRSCLYIYYSKISKSDNQGYIVIESQIADQLDKEQHCFEQHEVLDILNTELRCLLNMYPTNFNDVFGQNIRLEDYDFLQSMEVLDRQSICDFFLLDPEQIQKFTSKVDPHKIYKHVSVIEDFLQSKGNLQTHRNFFKLNGLLRGKGDISFDRNHSNTLFRCFDDGQTLKMLKEQQNTESFRGVFQSIKEVCSGLWYGKDKQDNLDQMKQKAVLQMSGNHILNYVLNKKPSVTENRFIFFLLDIFIDQGIQIESFFQNEQQYGVFVPDENHKSFASLIDMPVLPASSFDRSVIRLLGLKHELSMSLDEQSDDRFMKRFFTKHAQQNNISQDKIWVKGQDDVSKQDNIKNTREEQRMDSAKDFFEKQSKIVGDQDKVQHKVQSFIIDRSCINSDIKRLQLLNGLEVRNQEQWDLYELSKFLNRINTTYGRNIEDHPVLQKLTDALFHDSQRFYIWQIVAYLVYAFPFLFQLLYLDHINNDKATNFYDKDQNKYIIMCNLICIVVATGFFIIELIQVYVLGLVEYWTDARSYEFIWFFVQLIYTLMKIRYTNQSFPLTDYVESAKLAGEFQDLKIMILFSLANSFLLVLMGLKFFYFLTVFYKFGTMIKLITQTLNQISLFFGFYFLMLFVFSCIMMCLGYDINSAFVPLAGTAGPDGSIQQRRVYSETSIAQYFILTFNNSVGQISVPNLPLWKHIIDDNAVPIPGIGDGNKFQAHVMILLIWVFWIIIVIFLFIILCNFLIAYISQSYEDVLENKIQNIYQQRCILNDEYYLFRSFLDKFFKRYKLEKFNTFILSADFNFNLGKSDEHGNIGVIKKVQNTLSVHKAEITYEVYKNRAEMERVKDEMQNYRVEMTRVIRELDITKDEITNQVKALMDKNNFLIYDIIQDSRKFVDLKMKKDIKEN